MKKGYDFDKIFKDLVDTTLAEFYLSKEGNACCTLNVDGHQRTFALNSSMWQHTVQKILRKCDPPVRLRKYAFEDLQSYFLGEAYDCPVKRDVRIRSGRVSDTVIVDLCDHNGTCAMIHPGRVEYTTVSPIPFLRPLKQEPFPLPRKPKIKDFLKLFKKWQNLKNENDSLLILAWIITTLIGGHAYPILILTGGQGSGKTTFSIRLRKLVDPTSTMLQTAVKDPRDFHALVSNSFLVSFDNLSGISNVISDLLCAASTGGTVIIRELNTTIDEICVNIHRPIILNGIDDPTSRQDFQDRSIFIETKYISEDDRESESTLQTDFDNIYPDLIGGIFELISLVLLELPKVRTKGLKRMTEYSRIGIALERVLGLPDGFFMKVLNQNLESQKSNTMSMDDNLPAIIEKLKAAKNNEIVGSYVDILKQLNKGKSRGQALFKTSREFGSWRKRNIELLKRSHIYWDELEDHKTNAARIYRLKWEDPQLDIVDL
ncbi:MAG: hypothetical protein ACXWQQ_13650 [Pseudobdellovibrio sp.]